MTYFLGKFKNAVPFLFVLASGALVGCTDENRIKNACLEFKEYSESSDSQTPIEVMQKKFYNTLGITFYGNPENTEQMMSNVKAVKEADEKCAAAGAGKIFSIN